MMKSTILKNQLTRRKSKLSDEIAIFALLTNLKISYDTSLSCSELVGEQYLAYDPIPGASDWMH